MVIITVTLILYNPANRLQELIFNDLLTSVLYEFATICLRFACEFLVVVECVKYGPRINICCSCIVPVIIT